MASMCENTLGSILSIKGKGGGGAERTAIEVNSLFCCCFWTPIVYAAQADLELLGLLSNQSSCLSLLNNWNFPQGTQLVKHEKQRC